MSSDEEEEEEEEEGGGTGGVKPDQRIGGGVSQAAGTLDLVPQGERRAGVWDRSGGGQCGT